MIFIKRKLKLIIFFLIFIIVSPIIVLYANGDILGTGWSLFKTGGIYISGAPVGSEIFLNSKLKNTTSFFNRNILIKSLRPNKYEISVKKDGYNFWMKKIEVIDSIVSDANVFILPEKVESREIPRYLLPSSGIPTSMLTKKKNQEYVDVLDLFKAKLPIISKSSMSSSSLALKKSFGANNSLIMNGDTGLWQEGNSIFAGWFGRTDSAPKYFCGVSNCKEKTKVFDFNSEPRKIDFLPGYDGVAIISIENEIIALQIENNPEKTPQIIYKGNNPDFKIIEGYIYIKDGNFLAEALL